MWVRLESEWFHLHSTSEDFYLSLGQDPKTPYVLVSSSNKSTLICYCVVGYEYVRVQVQHLLHLAYQVQQVILELLLLLYLLPYLKV